MTESDCHVTSALLALVLADLPVLKSLPGVESIKVAVPCENPKLTVIHIRDWHFIEFETFKADIEGQVPEDQMAREFMAFAREVEEIQDRQEQILRVLARAGHKEVWMEGLTPPMEPIFLQICHAAAHNGLYASPNPLHVGAVGRLAVERVVTARALDTDEGLEAADPIGTDGSIREVSVADNEKREDLMIRQLAGRTGVAVIMLGGGHDLSNNVPEGVRLIEVTVKGYAAASGE